MSRSERDALARRSPAGWVRAGEIVRKGRLLLGGQGLEGSCELVGAGRAETPSAGLEILQHLVDLTDPSGCLYPASPVYGAVHQANIFQGRPAVGVCGRRLHKVSAGPSDPITGPFLLLLSQVAVLDDDFHRASCACSHDTPDI